MYITQKHQPENASQCEFRHIDNISNIFHKYFH